MTSQKSVSNQEVLIVGAGPTGLMLANLLARQGIKFRIIDENAARAKESRALAVQARSLELYQSLGLVDQVLSRGMQGTAVNGYMKGKKLLDVSFSGIGRDDTPYPYVFLLSQSINEEILEESLHNHGFKVERQTSLEHFEQNESKVTAHIKRTDGSVEIAEAKYLVGCDGARSNVRKSTGLSFKGGTYEQDFMLADTKVKWDLPHDRVQIFIGHKAMAIFFPINGAENSRVIVIAKNADGTKEAAENLTTRIPAALEEVQHKFEDAVGLKVKLEKPQWVTRYRVHHRSVEKMQLGRVFLAGDAAHIHSPAGGQGMNTGLQDAANLAWKLSLVLKGQAADELLETYNFERLPIAKKLLHFTDRIFSAAASFNPIAEVGISIFAPMVTKLAANLAPQFMFGFISQLNIHYHPSIAAVDKCVQPRRHTRATAGRRAPDAPVKNRGSLFELLAGYQFSVLIISKMPVTEAVRSKFETNWRTNKSLFPAGKFIWVDANDSPLAIKRYAVADVLVSLIRPDGYIAFQSDQLEEFI